MESNNVISSIIATNDGGYVFTGVNPYHYPGVNNGLWFVKIEGKPPLVTEPTEPTPSPPTEPSDITPPTIAILSPQNKAYTTTDVPLNFTVSELTKWIGCSLDGQDNATITGNVTLTGLSDGPHSVIVYAEDIVGNTGASETINFTIAEEPETIPEPFPTTLVSVVSGASAVAVGAGILVYFKKRKH